MSHSNSIAEGLKTIMRGLPVPLTIVTASNGTTRRGVTLSSFTPLSMNPPLVTFNIDCGSQFCKFFDTVEKFVVHFPSHNHAELCKRFATSSLSAEEQFQGVNYFENEYGAPVLSDISSHVYGTVKEKIKISDHYILIGRVLEIHPAQEGGGLLYHNRVFRTLEVV